MSLPRRPNRGCDAPRVVVGHELAIADRACFGDRSHNCVEKRVGASLDRSEGCLEHRGGPRVGDMRGQRTDDAGRFSEL